MEERIIFLMVYDVINKLNEFKKKNSDSDSGYETDKEKKYEVYYDSKRGK